MVVEVLDMHVGSEGLQIYTNYKDPYHLLDKPKKDTYLSQTISVGQVTSGFSTWLNACMCKTRSLSLAKIPSIL